ncbi:hypothetical protein P8452_70790 [Trifolium repens]|nr:hypothetical protein P8452_70790 [Trifolium repens]
MKKHSSSRRNKLQILRHHVEVSCLKVSTSRLMLPTTPTPYLATNTLFQTSSPPKDSKIGTEIKRKELLRAIGNWILQNLYLDRFRNFWLSNLNMPLATQFKLHFRC